MLETTSSCQRGYYCNATYTNLLAADRRANHHVLLPSDTLRFKVHFSVYKSKTPEGHVRIHMTTGIENTIKTNKDLGAMIRARESGAKLKL